MGDSATPWTAAHQASLSITNSWSLLKLVSIESVMPSNHLSLVKHGKLTLVSCFSFNPTKVIVKGDKKIETKRQSKSKTKQLQRKDFNKIFKDEKMVGVVETDIAELKNF